MKLRICKCCGKRIIVPPVQPSVQHLCQECGLPEELPDAAKDEEIRDQNSKIIFLDRFR